MPQSRLALPLMCLVFLNALVTSGGHAAEDPAHAQAIAEAMAAVEQAIPQAEADPRRPVYHFHSPAQWMNDPNGPMQVDGVYHMFYQHNPYDDRWDRMHWGHATSRDLVHWEHRPIALAPSYHRGEAHCFSGCGRLLADGTPALFYTSIPIDGNPTEIASQWMAVSHDGLETWTKPDFNPVLAPEIHGATRIWDWRDPYIFEEGGRTFLVAGGNLDRREEGAAVVSLYRAKDRTLQDWEHLGILFQHPDKTITNIECPNFFKVGEHWVLIYSPHERVEYLVGDFDLETFKFTPDKRGYVDHGRAFYAPNTLRDDKGRWIEWGWIRGYPAGMGWNGCLTLPRILSIDDKGHLAQRPAPELAELRGDMKLFSKADLSAASPALDWKGDAALELELRWKEAASPSGGIKILDAETGNTITYVAWEKNRLTAGDADGILRPAKDLKSRSLRVFLDRSVLEVYSDTGECWTSLIPYESGAVKLAPVMGQEESSGLSEIALWELASIW